MDKSGLLQQNRFPLQLIDRIIKTFLEKQYLVDKKPSIVPKPPTSLFLPYLGVCSIHLRKGHTKFLGKIYPMLTSGWLFGLINLLVAFSHLRIVSLVMFVPLLFTSLHVVAARLLTMEKHHAISLFGVESI